MLERIHTLKVDPEFWAAIASGDKPFEVRRDDRHFQRSDVLELYIFDPKLPVNWQLEMPSMWFRVTYVLRGGQFGVEQGHVVMGMIPIAPVKRP